MELVGAAPDVGAGAGDLVFARGRVELGGAFERGGADVDGAGEEAEGGGLRLSEGRGGEEAGYEQRTHSRDCIPGTGDWWAGSPRRGHGSIPRRRPAIAQAEQTRNGMGVASGVLQLALDTAATTTVINSPQFR